MASPSSSSDVIKQGQNVILKKGKSLKLYQVWKKRKVHLDKKGFYLDAAIGKTYGTTWEVRGTNIQLIDPENEDQDTASIEGGTDNRCLNDDKFAQKLRDVDIKALKDQGKQGQEIIGHLVKNSASFKEKTVYSQAKYLKRKRDKHIMSFQILRPNTMLLCEMYGTRAPSKNIHLRIDTLAQVLTYTNVQSGTNVMMIETCQGLLVGAFMERMAGKGTIVQLHSESVPVRLAVDAYNFPESYKETLESYPLEQLYLLETTDTTPTMTSVRDASGVRPSSGQGVGRNGTVDMQGSTITENLTDVSDVKLPVETTTGGGMETDRREDESVGRCVETSDSPTCEDSRKRKFEVNPEKEARRRRRRENISRVGNLLKSAKMDALVMACRFQPLPIFKSLFKFLAPSRPFVVYCHYIEPLMKCNEWLRDTGEAVNIRVTETWLREYQVLPERTHPHVAMSGTGGYLLAGVTVSNR